MKKNHILFCSIRRIISLTVILTISWSSSRTWANETLKVGVFQNKPIVYYDDGAKGLFVEVLNYVAEKENWKIEYVPCILKDCLNLLNANEIDLMTSVGETPDRLEHFEFSKESIWTFWGTVYSNDIKINGILDLKDKKIAVRKNNKTTQALQKMLDEFKIPVDFIEFDDYESAFKALQKKSLDAVTVNNTYAFSKQIGNSLLHKTPIVFNPFSAYFAVSKNSGKQNLLKSIDKHVKELKADKSSIYHAFERKWLGGQQKSYWTAKRVGIISGIFLILTVLFMAAWRFWSIVRVNEKLTNSLMQQKQIEAELLKQKGLLQKAQEIGQIGSWELDVKKNELTWTDQNYIIFGIPVGSNLTYESFLNCIHPDDREYVDREWKAGVEGKPYDIEHRLLLDGEVIWIREKADMTFDENGKAISAIGFTQDITERKNAEKDLKTAKENLKNTFDMSPSIISKADINTGYFTEISPVVTKILGFSVEEITSRPFMEFVHPDDRQRTVEEVSEQLQGKAVASFENRYLCKDGSYKWIAWEGTPADKNGIVTAIGSNINERKQAEQNLIESEAKYRHLYETMSQGVVIQDAEGRVIEANHAACEILGLTMEQMFGKTAYDPSWKLIHEDGSTYDPAEMPSNIVLRTRKPSKLDLCGIYVPGKDEYRWIMIGSAPRFKDGETKPFVTTTVFTDITERKQMEADSERHLAAIEQIAEGVVITDTDGSIDYVNPAFEKITGYSRQELIGQNPRILKSGKHDDAFYQQMWETITFGDTWKGSLINKRKNGSFYNEEATISPVVDKSGNIINFVAVKRDITDEIRMEERLRQSQKMESIGTLAGGIAHDFNNILFPIVGYTQMLLEDVPEDSLFTDSLKTIYTSALRAKSLVKQILTFSRQETGELILMKMQPIIKEALKLIRSTIPTTIEIKQDINADCGVIKADPTQIHQIVMNLCTNAYHAMEENGGELNVTLKEIQLGEHELIIPDMKSGSYACLTIADTGSGMDKQLTEKIFEPFFTTKEIGKGTGMGLSVVYGIIKNMNGAINVYSEPGEGTQFSVYLPLAESVKEQQATNVEAPIQGGTEHILLVDDEEAILTMEKQMLERLGYQVTSRTSSLEALEAFRASPDKFDMVITDMAMPNMSGDKLSVELTKIRPDIPVLLCTGFSETMSEETAASLGIKGFLLKPIVMKDLAQNIRGTLDKDKQ